jgi:hypothetical protein
LFKEAEAEHSRGGEAEPEHNHAGWPLEPTLSAADLFKPLSSALSKSLFSANSNAMAPARTV